MLLALRSLWENASADVIVNGEGVSANPQIGTGDVLITTGARGGIKRRRRGLRRREQRDYWVPVRMPVPINVTGEGVAARARIGTGNVLVEVDFSEDELLALLMLDAA
jgi:hypothetical protein